MKNVERVPAFRAPRAPPEHVVANPAPLHGGFIAMDLTPPRWISLNPSPKAAEVPTFPDKRIILTLATINPNKQQANVGGLAHLANRAK